MTRNNACNNNTYFVFDAALLIPFPRWVFSQGVHFMFVAAIRERARRHRGRRTRQRFVGFCVVTLRVRIRMRAVWQRPINSLPRLVGLLLLHDWNTAFTALGTAVEV